MPNPLGVFRRSAPPAHDAAQDPQPPATGTPATPTARNASPMLDGLRSVGKATSAGVRSAFSGTRTETNSPLHSSNSLGKPFNGFKQHVSVSPPAPTAAQVTAALAPTPPAMTVPAAPSKRTRTSAAQVFAKFNHAKPDTPAQDSQPAELAAFGDRHAYNTELMHLFQSGPLGLHSTLDGLAQPALAQQGREYERPALMAQTLSAVTGGDTNRAIAAVDYLRNTGLHFHAQPDPSRPDTSNGARADAWRTAQMLSTTAAGQSILRDLVHGGMPHDEDIALLHLQSSNQLAQAHPGSDASPEGIARLAGEGGAAHNTIAGRAATATSKFLHDGDDHNLNDGDYGAMLAARQHLYESGKGSDLSQTQHRLHKFITKTIPRSSESKWSRAKHLPQRLVNQRKNPLIGLADGVKGTNHATIAKNAAKIDGKSRDALTALDTHLSARDPQQLLDQPDAVDALLSHATTKHWLGQSMEHAQSRPDAEGREDVARHALTLYENLRTARSQPGAPELSGAQQQQFTRLQTLFERPGGGTRSAAELSANKTFATHTRTGFGPDTFGRLAAHAGWAKDANGAAPDGNPDAQAFWRNADAATKVMRMDDIKPDNMQPEGVHGALKELVSNIESGSKLTLSDGSRIGASTRGLSSNVGKFTSPAGMVVSPRLDLRYGFRREAVVTVSRSTHGGEIFLGTQKQHAGQAGVGLQVGRDLGLIRAAATVDATLFAHESTQPSGVSLRIARRAKADGSGYDDARLKEGMNGLVDYLFESAEHPPENPEAAWNQLGRKTFRNEDVSVTWANQKSTKSSSNVSASGGFGVKAAHKEDVGRFGAQVGIGYERTHKSTADSVDQNGRMQIESHRIGSGHRVTANASLPGGYSHNVDHDKIGIGVVSTSLPQGSVDLMNTGYMAKARLIREDGEYQHRVCYADTDFSSAREYEKAINANKGIWVEMFSRQKAKNPADQAKEDAMDPQARGMMKLNEHLKEVRANARPNQSFFHRFRLREHAAQELNLCNTAEAGMRARGAPDAELQKLEAWRSSVLNRPDSWLPIELKVYERNSSSRMHGLQAGLQLTTRTGQESERELIAETLGYRDLDRLDADMPKTSFR